MPPLTLFSESPKMNDAPRRTRFDHMHDALLSEAGHSATLIRRSPGNVILNLFAQKNDGSTIALALPPGPCKVWVVDEPGCWYLRIKSLVNQEVVHYVPGVRGKLFQALRRRRARHFADLGIIGASPAAPLAHGTGC
jgi:hypothetical protein